MCFLEQAGNHGVYEMGCAEKSLYTAPILKHRDTHPLITKYLLITGEQTIED